MFYQTQLKAVSSVLTVTDGISPPVRVFVTGYPDRTTVFTCDISKGFFNKVP